MEKLIITPKEDTSVTMTIRINRSLQENTMNFLPKQTDLGMN